MRAGTWNEEAAAGFSALLQKLSPKDTIIHAHQIRDSLTPSIIRTAIDRGFATLFTSHDYSLGCPYGGFLDAPTGTVCQRRGMSLSCILAACNTTGRIKKAAILYKHRTQQKRGRLPSGLTGAIYVSEFSRKVLEPYTHYVPIRKVIPNPIEVERTEPARPYQNSPFVFVGILNVGKDPLTAARAARLASVPIRFIGDGPLLEDVRSENPDAECAGWLPPDQALTEIRNARALIFPSKFLETQGMVAYEALANGIPVIASSTTAASEAVVASGGGLLFEAGNAEDLAQKLRTYNDIERAHNDGKRGFEWYWSAPPTMAKHIESLQMIYEEALESHRTR